MKIALYRGTRSGLQGLFSLLVRLWTRSSYSHVELVFSDGLSASASWVDGGVRFKQIDYSAHPERWVIFDVPGDEAYALQWFRERVGKSYDILGLLGFVWPARGGRDKWFCSKAFMASLGYSEANRFHPGHLHALFRARYEY